MAQDCTSANTKSRISKGIRGSVSEILRHLVAIEDELRRFEEVPL